ncbi:MAG: hypothetical protein HOW97_11790 [Catenulispora sp.]|nr:hypothetical protein [Catenulispora sp.]
MKIGFFNVQRMGSNTDSKRRNRLTNKLNNRGVDMFIMCELLPRCGFPPARNCNYRLCTSRQLCYGAVYDGDTTLNIQRVLPLRTQPYRHPVTHKNFYPGGSDFRKLANRGLGRVIPPAGPLAHWPGPAGGAGGVDIYCFHAPASKNAERAVAFLACWLETVYQPVPPPGAPAGLAPYYLLVGDMNLEPEELEQSKIYTVNNLTNQIANCGMNTHRSLRGRDRELDWALTNMDDVEVTTTWGGYARGSDHLPIFVEY